MKVLLIGGHPKGHERPFDPSTLSGKRLRQMVDEIKLDAIYLDLWQTEEEEERGKMLGYIDNVALSIVKHHLNQGTQCVALGRRVQTCLLIHGIDVLYLPHPASRRLIDKERLRKGLEELRDTKG